MHKIADTDGLSVLGTIPIRKHRPARNIGDAMFAVQPRSALNLPWLVKLFDGSLHC